MKKIILALMLGAGILTYSVSYSQDSTKMAKKNSKVIKKAMKGKPHKAMKKDMKTEKIRDAADGDYVYSWMRYSGTSDGSMGMPKGPYSMSVIELAKFNNGKAVEHWSFLEMPDMAKMMGQHPADTTKMK